MVVMTTSTLSTEGGSSPERGRTARGSRIAAARARAEAAKTVVLVAALIAFFAAMLAERGAASAASHSTPASTSLPADDSGGFEPGWIAPTQSEPSTSTGTS
jgi:hypothetical protein